MKRINKELLSDLMNRVEKLENLERHNEYREIGIYRDDISKTGRFMEAEKVLNTCTEMREILARFSI